MSFSRALSGKHGEEWEADDAWEGALLDWEADIVEKGISGLDRYGFEETIFELVDLWTPTIDAQASL